MSPKLEQSFEEFQKTVKERVKKLPELSAQVLALRCALRVFPVLGLYGHFKYWGLYSDAKKRYINAVEHALYLSYLALKAKVIHSNDTYNDAYAEFRDAFNRSIEGSRGIRTEFSVPKAASEASQALSSPLVASEAATGLFSEWKFVGKLVMAAHWEEMPRNENNGIQLRALV